MLLTGKGAGRQNGLEAGAFFEIAPGSGQARSADPFRDRDHAGTCRDPGEPRWLYHPYLPVAPGKPRAGWG